MLGRSIRDARRRSVARTAMVPPDAVPALPPVVTRPPGAAARGVHSAAPALPPELPAGAALAAVLGVGAVRPSSAPRAAPHRFRELARRLRLRRLRRAFHGVGGALRPRHPLLLARVTGAAQNVAARSSAEHTRRQSGSTTWKWWEKAKSFRLDAATEKLRPPRSRPKRPSSFALLTKRSRKFA